MNEFDIDKREVRRAFSKAALTYDAAAIVQREVCMRMIENLGLIKVQPARILDAGSGTGRGTRDLAIRYGDAEIVSLDIALGMLQRARASRSWKAKWLGDGQRFLCADIEALPFSAQCFDMVWSSLAVQWCNDLPAALQGLHRVLRDDGLLMFSTFGPDTLKELRIAFSGVDGYNHVSRFADMHDIGDMLVAAGFADPVIEMEKITLTYDDVRAVMRDLKSIGAHNATAGRAQGLMGKARWQAVALNYERLRQHGKLPATFEIVYAHAWKAPLKTTGDGRAVIRMDLRR